MAERIESLQVDFDKLRTNLFFNSPADFVVFCVAKTLREDPVWGPLFGVSASDGRGFIDDYMREDYPARSFPALRLYNESYDKQFESWFVEGDVIADIIFPASIRRPENQYLQDILSGAMMQQFRRPKYFNQVGALVPGLNELGKRFAADKSLGFKWGENAVPLTQLRINFKIDLRIWDDYLEQTDRTKDSPFEPVLGDLTRIVSHIQALREGSDTPEITITADQNTKL